MKRILEGIGDGAIVKVSGVLGGSSAGVGIFADLSQYSASAQVLADFGIFIGSIVALLSFVYSIYKGFKNKPKS